jgi:U3 small nucleolar RNA-associated protein 11
MTKGPQARAHRERAQPSSRARLGLLEKHSDYLQRARDHHRKQDRLKALQVRAQYKNPNEFAFGMVKSAVAADGSHRDGPEKRALPTEVVRIMKSQDLSYVRLMKKVNEGRLRKLVAPAANSSSQRTTFYDSEDEADILSTSENVHANMTLQKQSLTPGEVTEVKIRQERLSKLRIAERELENQRLLMGSGKRKKLGVDENGVSVFKWAPIRKK